MALTYDSIATTTISGTGTSTITFSGISNAYTDLRIILSVAPVVNASVLRIRLNNDTSASYNFSTQAHFNGGWQNAWSQSANHFVINDNNFNATPGLVIVDVLSYLSNQWKSCAWNVSNMTSSAENLTQGVGLWNNTSAITSISFSWGSGNFANNSKATLFGIKAA